MDTNKMYRLVDGTQADPKDCAVDGAGVLRHKDGLAVAMRDTGEPQTIGSDAELGGNVAAAAAGVPAPGEKTITVAPASSPPEPMVPSAPLRGAAKAD